MKTTPPATTLPRRAPDFGKKHWHGKKCLFGFHLDLHVDEKDRDIGTRCSAKELVPMLRLTSADFVQTDSKGHTGYTSWFSKTPGASVGPGVVKDALRQWRVATRKLGLPLHAHYSGIIDIATAMKHPEWCVQSHDGKPGSTTWRGITYPTNGKMCPRGPYLEKLMIPQLIEMIDRYGIDGFWIDGDIWGAEPCYCERCRKAFAERTGIAEPPKEPADSNWAAWWNFTRESCEEYVTRYCEAVHRHKPGVLVCSSTLQTFNHPGEPKVPTDWISGDNTWDVDRIRCEARFISTRGKPWDIMMWCMYFSHGELGKAKWTSTMKPVQMFQQEAAIIVAFGGNFQTCENPFDGVRTGQLVPWRMKRIGALARFVKRRRSLCQDAATIPQVAVLHSEHHIRATPTGKSLRNDIDLAPVWGAVLSLLECHYGVDILDEWAILPRLADFPMVVAPEQNCMSDGMVVALKEYVKAGGRLLVSGAKAFERFGQEFLGVKAGKVMDEAIYHVPVSDDTVPILSAPWRLVETATAKSLGTIGVTPLRGEQLLPHPAATLNRVGKGAVAYIPCNVFRDFQTNGYPLTRVFVHDVMRALAGRLEIEVKAPVCVDVILRRKGGKKIIHLINRSSGIPKLPNSVSNSVVTDEIPSVGPAAITLKLSGKPKKVRLAFENAAIRWKYVAGRKGGILRVDVPIVHIHAAVVVE